MQKDWYKAGLITDIAMSQTASLGVIGFSVAPLKQLNTKYITSEAEPERRPGFFNLFTKGESYYV